MAVYPTESAIVNEWLEATMSEATRDNLLVVLAERFPGAVPNEIVKTIHEQPSRDVLNRWFRRAATVETMEDYVAFLRLNQ